jgi:hypothetical protein
MRTPHVEARDRPYGQVIHRLEVPGAGEPPQGGSRGKLAPSDGDVAAEGEQAGRLPGCCELFEVVLVVLTGPVAVTGTDAPVHAPASVRGPGFAEEVFERGPLLGGERANREVHHGVLRWSLVCFAVGAGSAGASWRDVRTFHAAPRRVRLRLVPGASQPTRSQSTRGWVSRRHGPGWPPSTGCDPPRRQHANAAQRQYHRTTTPPLQSGRSARFRSAVIEPCRSCCGSDLVSGGRCAYAMAVSR